VPEARAHVGAEGTALRAAADAAAAARAAKHNSGLEAPMAERGAAKLSEPAARLASAAATMSGAGINALPTLSAAVHARGVARGASRGGAP